MATMFRVDRDKFNRGHFLFDAVFYFYFSTAIFPLRRRKSGMADEPIQPAQTPYWQTVAGNLIFAMANNIFGCRVIAKTVGMQN